jgi:sugar phosphate isomerase/epimerase
VAAGVAAVPFSGLRAPAAAALPRAAGDDPWRGLRAGVASYSLRELPLEDAIAAIQRLDLRYVSIKSFHLPLESTTVERRAVAARFAAAGITPLSAGNITMQDDEADVRRAFEYARDLGLAAIVCSPHPDSMPILDAMVKEFDIRVAIHNHGPEDERFPSPYDVWSAVESYDRRVGLCIDAGHTARAGVDPAEAIRRCRERLYDFHIKDIDSREPEGRTLEMGRGVLDVPAMLAALLEVGYEHLLSFEYEKDPDDPLPGLAESVGYVKGILRALA